MDTAKTVAWNVYVARVQRVVNEQRQQYEAGGAMAVAVLAAPSEAEIAIICAALNDAALNARREVVRLALGPIAQACDAIDNSHTKSSTVKDIRADLQCAYDALHKVRAESRQSAAAVDPHTGTSNA